jgi:hypothetical protein
MSSLSALPLQLQPAGPASAVDLRVFIGGFDAWGSLDGSE